MLFFLGILVGLFSLVLVDVISKRLKILQFMNKFPCAPRHVLFGNLINFKGMDPSSKFFGVP